MSSLPPPILHWPQYERLLQRYHTTRHVPATRSIKARLAVAKDYVTSAIGLAPKASRMGILSSAIEARLANYAAIVECEYSKGIGRVYLRVMLFTGHYPDDDKGVVASARLHLYPAFDIIRRYLQAPLIDVTSRPMELVEPKRGKESKHRDFYESVYPVRNGERTRVGPPIAVSVTLTYGPCDL